MKCFKLNYVFNQISQISQSKNYFFQQCGRYRLGDDEDIKDINSESHEISGDDETQTSLKKNVHFDEYDPREEWKVERREKTCYMRILRRLQKLKACMC